MKDYKAAYSRFHKAVEGALSIAEDCETMDRLDTIGLYTGWADNPDKEILIVATNWNDVRFRRPAPFYWEQAHNIMSRLKNVVDKMQSLGYPIEAEYDDSITDCDECHLAVNLHPSHARDIPYHLANAGKVGEKLLCRRCFAKFSKGK